MCDLDYKCKDYRGLEDCNEFKNISAKPPICFNGKSLTTKEAPSSSPSSVGLGAPDQAIEALEILAKYWESIGAHLEASSNREYMKVIRGQVICRNLVDKEKGA